MARSRHGINWIAESQLIDKKMCMLVEMLANLWLLSGEGKNQIFRCHQSRTWPTSWSLYVISPDCVVESLSVVDVCWFNVVVVKAASVVVAAAVVCAFCVVARTQEIDHHSSLIDRFIYSFAYSLILLLKPYFIYYMYLMELCILCNSVQLVIVEEERLSESPEFMLNRTVWTCHINVLSLVTGN